MLTTGLGTFLSAFLVNFLAPLIPGILFLWLFFGTRWKGGLLYLLAWFVGVGVIAHFLFNLQFVRFGIGIGEYLLLLGVLICALTVKSVYFKHELKTYLNTLRVSCQRKELRSSRESLTRPYKRITGGMLVAVGWFLVTSLVFTSNFPTYADDSFNNRNKPILNILHDGGVKIFGEKDQILARGRLGYPIHVPIYKALIADMTGGYNDVYNKLFQRYIIAFGFAFIGAITWEKTKHIFRSVLPVGLLTGLPLLFIHSVEGYMELPSVIYAILAVRALYEYLQQKDLGYVLFASLFAGILIHIKNDGMVVYMPALVCAFLWMLYKQQGLKDFFQSLIRQKWSGIGLLAILAFFWVPFLAVKMIYGLGFNQAAGAESGAGISSTLHREIFNVIPSLFTSMDNYGLALMVVILMIWWCRRLYASGSGRHDHEWVSELLFVLAPALMFLFLLAVFLSTENYKFVLDQTTVNRVFSMCLVMLYSFSGICGYAAVGSEKL